MSKQAETANRPIFSFDGKGINGPDEYRSRLATLTPSATPEQGRLMAAAPELLEALEAMVQEFAQPYPTNSFDMSGAAMASCHARTAIAKAKGE